jgi:hypothetical protein
MIRNLVSPPLGGSRDGIRKALDGLEQDCQSPNHEYWAVDADLRDLSDSQRSRLIGPNQIAGHTQTWSGAGEPPERRLQPGLAAPPLRNVFRTTSS